MSGNRILNWSEFIQNQPNLKQTPLINSNSQQHRTKKNQALSKNKADLERLRTLYENLPCICFILNAMGGILSVSQFGAASLGYDSFELTHQPISTIIYWEDQASFNTHLIEIQKQSNQIEQWQARLVHKNGNLIQVKVRTRLVLDSPGNPLILLIFEEMTTSTSMKETGRNSEVLQENLRQETSEAARLMTQARMQHLFSSSPIIIYSCNALGDYSATFVSDNITSILGYKAEEFLTDSRFWRDRIHPEDASYVFSSLHHLFERESHTIEYRFLHKDGTYRWMQDKIKLVGDIANNTREIVGAWQDISERKLAEEKLRQSEQNYRILAKNIPNCVAYLFDKNLRFIIAEGSEIQTVGLTQEQVEGKTLREALEPEICTLLEPFYYQTLEGKTITTEFSWAEQTYILQLAPLKNAQGEVYGGVALTQNVTHVCNELRLRQQAESALRESEKRFRLLAENSTDMISQHTPEGIYLYASPACRRLLGYEPEDLIGQSAYEFFHPDDLGEIRKTHGAILDSPEPYTVAYRIRRKDGQYIWFETTCRTIQDSQTATVQEIHCASRDITDRKRAEETLQESEERFRAIADSAPMLLWMSDSQGLCTFFNERWLTFTGRSLEQELGNGWTQGVHPDDLQSCLETYLSAFKARQEFKMEYRLQQADGEYRWILNTGTPRFTSTGGFVGYVGSCVDITERKQAEEVLHQQVLKEQLVGAIARRIHQSLKLKDILNTTVAEVRQFLACDRVIIFRLHGDGSGVVVVESVGSQWNRIAGTSINDRHFADAYIQLYKHGRVQAIEDICKAGLTPCHFDLLNQFQVRANLVVPIVHEEKLWGLLVAQQCSEPRKWQPLEIDLLKSLATQAAIAIHQSELYQQAQTEITQRQQVEAALRHQFQREQLVSAIAQRIRKSLNLDEILNATVAEVRQVLQTDRVIIFRFESDWSGNVVVESVDSQWSAILGKNIYDPCFEQEYVLPYQQGRVRAIEDIQTENLSKCHFDLLAQFEVRANLVVPILNGEQLWGLLIAHHCSGARIWQQGEIDLLCSLASQVAIAIQQSQLYEQAQAQAKREQALNQVTQAIRSSLDLNTIFATAVPEIGKLLQVDRAVIMQYLPELEVWSHVSEYRKHSNLTKTLGLKIPDTNNPIAEQLKQLEIVKIYNAQTCTDECQQCLARAFPGAWLLVPLHFGSKLWGTLGLVMDVGPYHWQDTQVELISEVADQLAIALQQAELYQQSCTATATALRQAKELEKAFQELQRTQAQLVQSEKMSSLGQLVAGVAHEINNPVSFIYGNLVHAYGYTKDLLGLIQLYQQQYPNATSDIQSEIEVIDLEFLIEDLPKLLDSMKVGAERICEIVGALRNFSRLSEAEMKAVDIHEGLDSTLMILQNRLKASGRHPEIQVIKEYGGLPQVECYAGQLNQVFMNLLTNAIDAIDEQNQGRTPEEIQINPSIIRIKTELLGDRHIAICIADNGPGMTEQVKVRLFDPFFTTKPVGTGTGLGLSISYQIVVEKHGGKISCYSQLGQGTEFVIQIPIQQFQENT